MNNVVRKRDVVVVLCGLLIWAQNVQADKIHMTNGTVMEGDIVEQGSYYVTVMTKQGGRKFLRSEIERIEKKALDDRFTPETVVDLNQFEEIPSDKAKLILKFMEVNGTKSNMEESLRQTLAEAPVERRDEIEALLNIDEIITRLIPVVDKYFTEEDLKILITFYTSDTGIKFINTSPQLIKEVIESSIGYFKENLNR